MATNKQSTVVGVFDDPSHAQQAVRELKAAGFREDQIGVVSHNREAAGEKDAVGRGTHAAEGAVAGVAAGAGVGALWALGIAAGFMPVIGPVVAGGILASVLASAAGGAAIAGLVGALVGLGIPEDEAKYYESEFKSGRTIVTVKAEGRFEEAWSILHSHGAYNKQTQDVATPAGAARVEGGQTMRLHQEELHASKVPVKTGEAHVRKEVVTENQTLQVPVTHEEMVVERRPVSGQAASGAAIKAGEEVRIPLMEEKVRLEKETVAKEEVAVGKRKVTGTEQVTGTVRKEQAHVEKEGDVEVRGDNAARKDCK